jgi:gliding motility-associated-like protein
VARVTSAAAGGICSGTAQHYVIQSNIPTATFNWSRAQVPNITNDAVTVQNSGVINETLISTSSNPVKVVYVITPYFDNCPGKPFNYVLLVTPQPAPPIANSNSPVCLGSTIKFNTVQIPGATYLWTGPNGFSSILQNPTIANVNKNHIGTYSLTVTTNGCSSVATTVDVLVNDPPLAKAGNDTIVCADVQAIQLNGKISRGTTTGVWTTFGTGKFSPSSDQLNAVYVPSSQDIQNGKVTLRLTSTSKDDCRPNFDDMIITILPNPVANAGGNKDVCSQDISVQLNAKGSNYNGALWTTSGTGTFNPAATDIDAIYMPSALDKQNGSVKLRLKLTGVSVCSAATDSLIVKFIPPPTVDAGKEITLLRGESTVLNPTVSDPNVHYLWTPNLNINNNTLKNPTITADRDQVYTLMVTDSRGCVSEDQISIKVLDPIVVSNTITPNGDGINDVWNIPALSRYPEATVDIFNRNGEKIFHSLGYGKAWDGSYNGQPLPVGVYYYVIDTKFEGRIVTGYITIIR